GRSTADVVDEFPEVEAERNLVVTGALHVPGDTEKLGAWRLFRAPLPVPGPAVVHDVRHRAQRLHIIDRGWAGECAGYRREGRLHTRLAPATLQRVHQPRLLAADVGSGTEVKGEIQRVAAPHHVFACIPRRVSLLDRACHDLG